MKKVLPMIMLSMSLVANGATKFTGTKNLAFVYKVLSTLDVNVEATKPMKVKPNIGTFKYSEQADSGKGHVLMAKVEMPQQTRDEILDSVYGSTTMYFSDSGNFDMVDKTDSTKVIDARAFFPEVKTGDDSRIVIHADPTTTSNYVNTAQIDVMFNEEGKELLSGSYKGVVNLNVMYGE